MPRHSARVQRYRTAWKPEQASDAGAAACERSRLMASVDAYDIPKSGRMRNRPTNAKAVLYSPNGRRAQQARGQEAEQEQEDVRALADGGEEGVAGEVAARRAGAGSDVRPPAPCGAGRRGRG